MGGETGIVKVKESKYDTYTYTIKFVEGFMLLEQSDGDVQYFFYKPGQNLGSPNTKKLIGSWGNKIDGAAVNFTFNSDGTGTKNVTYTDGKYYDTKETFTYNIENAYVAKLKEYDDDGIKIRYYAAIMLNNKVYIYGDMTDPILILSKK